MSDLQQDLTQTIAQLEEVKSFLSNVRNIEHVADTIELDDLRQIQERFTYIKQVIEELNMQLPAQLLRSLKQVNDIFSKS